MMDSISFAVDAALCTECGECVADCPARIITMEGEVPNIAPEQEAACYRCQHCLTICPTGAVSILGRTPAASRTLSGNLPDADAMETLIKGRRSVRRYLPGNLEPELLQRLLDVAWHAPTGRSSRDVLFTVVDDREMLVKLRTEVMTGLGRLVQGGWLPQELSFFADIVTAWEEHGTDVLFKDAPHLLIASAPRTAPSPEPDCLIALSYFELFARSLGVGTVWNGLVKLAISDLLPVVRRRIGIPQDHVIGYAMTFGRPAVSYARTVQHGTAAVRRVGL